MSHRKGFSSAGVLLQVPVSSSLTLSTLQDCVRINFRTGGSAEGEEASKLLDQVSCLQQRDHISEITADLLRAPMTNKGHAGSRGSSHPRRAKLHGRMQLEFFL